MIIGLTGNIGSGKSLAAVMLAEWGAAVIDADQVGHRVLLPGGAAYQPVIERFGRQFVGKDTHIDRKKLGSYVFADPSGKRLRQLNALTHPAICGLIRAEIDRYLAAGRRVIVVEAAVLFDSPLTELMDETWLITAPREVLLQRVRIRDGCSAEEARQRLDSQRPEEKLRVLADRVFVNDGAPEQLKSQLKQAFSEVEHR